MLGRLHARGRASCLELEHESFTTSYHRITEAGTQVGLARPGIRTLERRGSMACSCLNDETLQPNANMVTPCFRRDSFLQRQMSKKARESGSRSSSIGVFHMIDSHHLDSADGTRSDR